MFHPKSEIILASRSPRRYELLSRLVPPAKIRVVAPRNPNEADFDNLRTRDDIAARLLEIAADKARDVAEQFNADRPPGCMIAADTVIVVGSDEQDWHALGQPPEADWQNAVRQWFREHYAGKTHLAMTALHIDAAGAARARVITTEITFRGDVENLLEPYIASGEPRGKAGGYAIQGLGSLFVERVEGSFTNVIGLPLRELVEMLRELGVVS